MELFVHKINGKKTSKKRMVVVGSGPIRIGQGI